MAPRNNDDRRGAERHTPPKTVPATFGGFAAEIVDISLIGCRIKHSDRLPARSRMPLRFSWRGATVRLDATVVRSEMTSVGGKPAYISGLEFCDSVDASPPVIRDIVGWLAATAAKGQQTESKQPESTQPESTQPERTHVSPSVSDEIDAPELLSAEYIRCTLTAGKWSKLYVDRPAQPRDGFTIRTPDDEREVDLLCRAYEQADAKKRLTMRASFERANARNKR